jgi:hypothetical protein
MEFCGNFEEAAVGIEPTYKGFADLCLTAWLRRPFCCFTVKLEWSGKRDSNPRPQPWQGCTLPLSYSRPNDTSHRGLGERKLNITKTSYRVKIVSVYFLTPKPAS